MKVETTLEIAMKNTLDFLEDQSGLPNQFLENIKLVSYDYAVDIIKDQGDTIKTLLAKIELLKSKQP